MLLTLRAQYSAGVTPRAAADAVISALSPAAWYRNATGVTSAGGFASQWDDYSGNARHLVQATGTNQPAYAAGVFTFDGVDNLMRATFTLDQPETVVLVLNQSGWTSADTIFDGNTTNAMRLLQAGDNGVGSSAQVVQYAGNYGIFTTTTAMTIGTFSILISVYNGASSVIRVNNQADFTTGGTAGASNAGGFVLGSQGDGGGTFSAIECKEAIVFPSAIADADRSALVTALANALSVTV